jgi:hypothetical protein
MTGFGTWMGSLTLGVRHSFPQSVIRHGPLWDNSAPGAHADIDVARNYARDEGRPLGAGLQKQASKRLKLL